jgi:hypothetical protein
VVWVEDWWSISKDDSVALVEAGDQGTDDSLVPIKAGHCSTEDSVSGKRLSGHRGLRGPGRNR